MAILKNIAATFVIVFMTTALMGQTEEQLQKAFSESYVHEYKGELSKAIADLQTVLRSDSYETNLRLGWLNYSLKKYSTAMEYYQKAIDLKKFSVEARFGFINASDAARQYEKSYQKYEEILKIDPYNKTANYWVGVNFYAVKKYEQASKYFELVVNMYPFDYDGNHMLGWTYLFLGRSGEAKMLFEKALLYKPSDPSAKDGWSKCR